MIGWVDFFFASSSFQCSFLEIPKTKSAYESEQIKEGGVGKVDFFVVSIPFRNVKLAKVPLDFSCPSLPRILPHLR